MTTVTTYRPIDSDASTSFDWTVFPRIAILVVHRGDRPRFLANLNRMIAAQTLQPVKVFFVDYPPVSDECDITPRYRFGYNYLSSLPGIDLIAVMEVDDWYSPMYLESMAIRWTACGKPDLFGIDRTPYYNIRVRAYFMFNHPERASMMSTLVRPRLKIDWPKLDIEPYTDSQLWMNNAHLSKKTVRDEPPIAIGIKGIEGMTGGAFHVDKLHRYKAEHKGTPDENWSYIKGIVDAESFEFYSGYFVE